MSETRWRLMAADWSRAVRIIPTRVPFINTCHRLAPPKHAASLGNLEALTNERLREVRGETRRVPAADRPLGTSASILVFPFTHVRANLFNTDAFGVLSFIANCLILSMWADPAALLELVDPPPPLHKLCGSAQMEMAF